MVKCSSTISKGLLKKFRHRQTGFVYVAVVIHGFEALVGGILLPEPGQILLAGHRRTPPPGGIYALGEKHSLQMSKATSLHFTTHFLQDFHVQQRGFALLDDDTVFGKAVEAITIEIGTEQTFRRPDRIGAVDDDDVDTIWRSILDPFDAVDEFQLGAWVVIGIT